MAILGLRYSKRIKTVDASKSLLIFLPHGFVRSSLYVFICRKLYYSDHGDGAHIGCANLDGTNYEKLITSEIADIVWPNGIAIDSEGIYAFI